MEVLVVNAGSTSLKLHLVRSDTAEAVDGFVPADAVGHRVVHGGRRFEEPTLITQPIERAIEELSALAPLHNRRALATALVAGGITLVLLPFAPPGVPIVAASLAALIGLLE